MSKIRIFYDPYLYEWERIYIVLISRLEPGVGWLKEKFSFPLIAFGRGMKGLAGLGKAGQGRRLAAAMKLFRLLNTFIKVVGRNFAGQKCIITFVNMDIKAGILNKDEAEKLERIAYILKTVAHPLRLGIVHLLEKYPRLSVGEICEMLDSEQSLTSHHLQNMRLKGLLSVKREGRSMYYSLKERDVSLIIECLENCQCNM